MLSIANVRGVCPRQDNLTYAFVPGPMSGSNVCTLVFKIYRLKSGVYVSRSMFISILSRSMTGEFLNGNYREYLLMN